MGYLKNLTIMLYDTIVLYKPFIRTIQYEPYSSRELRDWPDVTLRATYVGVPIPAGNNLGR